MKRFLRMSDNRDFHALLLNKALQKKYSSRIAEYNEINAAIINFLEASNATLKVKIDTDKISELWHEIYYSNQKSKINNARGAAEFIHAMVLLGAHKTTMFRIIARWSVENEGGLKEKQLSKHYSDFLNSPMMQSYPKGTTENFKVFVMMHKYGIEYFIAKYTVPFPKVYKEEKVFYEELTALLECPS